jgi:hypothetical protein
MKLDNHEFDNTYKGILKAEDGIMAMHEEKGKTISK